MSLAKDFLRVYQNYKEMLRSVPALPRPLSQNHVKQDFADTVKEVMFVCKDFK